MNAPYIDAHCHLDLFKDIQNTIVQEDNLGIKTISVTNAPYVYQPNVELFKNAKNIRVGLGFHPELAAQYPNQLTQFYSFLSSTRYIGEIGLDGSPRFKNSYNEQRFIFENILSAIADSNDKVVTVHSRNAASETIDILYKHLKKTNTRVILHWYSGDKASLLKAVNYGYFFSINHKMLFSENGLSIVKAIPKKHILTETDAPFTFDDKIKNRIDSLNYAIIGLSKEFNCEKDQMKTQIYSNFKGVLAI